MSRVISLAGEATASPLKLRLYLRMAVLLGTSILVCTTVVYFFGNQLVEALSSGVATFADVALASLLPYVVTALVASMTLLAITTILPSARAVEPSEMILQRLRQLSGGDLTVKDKISADGSMREIAQELNRATGMIRMQMNELKLINRQQWMTL